MAAATEPLLMTVEQYRQTPEREPRCKERGLPSRGLDSASAVWRGVGGIGGLRARVAVIAQKQKAPPTAGVLSDLV
jgi:hypothetical protein